MLGVREFRPAHIASTLPPNYTSGYQTAAVVFQASGNLKLKKHDADSVRGDVLERRIRSSTVTGDGPEQRHNLVIARHRPARRRLLNSGSLEFSGGSRALKFKPHDRPHRRHDIGRLGHGCCALLEQAIGAFGPRIERRAWNGEYFAALFERKPRGDQ